MNRYAHGEKPQIPDLSEPAKRLLAELPDTGEGAVISGSTLRAADQLVRRNLARCLGPANPPRRPSREVLSKAARYIRTSLGSKEVASWSRK